MFAIDVKPLPATPDSPRTDCTPQVLTRERVTELASSARGSLAFLAQPDLFGDVIEHRRFVEAYRSALIPSTITALARRYRRS